MSTASPTLKEPLPAVVAYERTMSVVRTRLLTIGDARKGASGLMLAELIALQVRKIIEGVAFASLSALELRNDRIAASERTKDPARLLEWLEKRKLLRLP